MAQECHHRQVMYQLSIHVHSQKDNFYNHPCHSKKAVTSCKSSELALAVLSKRTPRCLCQAPLNPIFSSAPCFLQQERMHRREVTVATFYQSALDTSAKISQATNFQSGRKAREGEGRQPQLCLNEQSQPA